MRERMRRNASRMAASEARAEDLMARRRTGSMAGAVVEVARSIRDAMEESAAAEDEEGSEPSSDLAAGRGCARRLAKEEEAVGRGMAAIRRDRRTRRNRRNRKPCWAGSQLWGFWTRFPPWLMGPSRIDVGSFDGSICPFSE